MNQKLEKPGDRQDLVKRNECMKLEQDAMLQELVRRMNSSSVLTASLERSCLGRL